jgi:uncharacterized membrane protein
MELEAHLQPIMNVLIIGVETAGALVVVNAVIRALARYVISLFSPAPLDLPRLRFMLGQNMIMGLEFQVAADILKTALSPTWNDILQLAALVAMRTVLNYLLEQEMEHLCVVEQRPL